MPEIFLIQVSGDDRPGVTSALMDVMAGHGVTVLDIGQAVIHDTLSLGFLAQMPDGMDSAPLFKDLLFKGHELAMKIKFRIVEEENYEQWVEAQGQPRYIVTLLARRLTAAHFARLTGIIAEQGLNIHVITRLTGRPSVRRPDWVPRACVEFAVRGEPRDVSAMRAAFLLMAQELGVDVAFQEDDAFRRNRRLIAFDMDSTLIQTEVIDELAAAAGVGDEVAAITESAMRGEIEFQESFRRRVGLLRGLDESVMAAIAERLPLTPGAERLIDALKQLGFTIAILSGGFTYFGEHLKKKLGADYVFANELDIRDGKATGEVHGQIVDGPRKAALLKEIAENEGIRLEQVIAVGDGANDLPMLNAAGLGIAFHAKPMVRESADQALSNVGLDGILYLIGVRDREVLQAIEEA